MDAATGAFYTDRELLNLRGARNLSFGIHYNSRLLLGLNGPLGVWYHDYEANVAAGGSTLALNWGGKRTNSFAWNASLGAFSGVEHSVFFDRIAVLGNGTYQLTRQSGERYLFNTNGTLEQVADKAGKALNLVHDPTSGRLLTVMEPVSGASLAFSYNTNGRVSQVTGSDGRKVVIAYSGKLLTSHTVQNADGSSAVPFFYSYDQADRLLTSTSSEGTQVVSNTYDALSRVVTQQDGTSPAVTVGGKTIPAKPAYTTYFRYDDTSEPGFRTTYVTNRVGGVITLKHDSDLPLVSRTEPGELTTSYTYDTNGNMATRTDPAGNATRYQYDERGNRIQVTDAETNVTIVAYDNANNLLSVVNPLSQVASFGYDTNNQPVAYTNRSGNRILTQYDTNGAPTLITSPGGGQTVFSNVAGRPLSVTDPNGSLAQYEYDAAGRVTARIDGAGKRWEYGYDVNDNLVSVKDPLGHTNGFEYGWHGEVTRRVDPLGNETRFSYDANVNLRARLDPNGAVTEYCYDPEDRMVTSLDALGRTNTFGYDPAGRLVSSMNPVQQGRGYSYDAAGNLVQELDATGTPLFTAAYTPLNRLKSTVDALGSQTRFSVDALGRRTGQMDPLGRSQTFVHDPEGRVSSVQTPLNTSAGQAFDADGNRIAITNEAGAVWSFTYDLGGRMTTMRSPLGRVTSYGYDGRNLLTSLTEPSGRQTTLTYDDAGRLALSSDQAGAIGYTYDNKNRLLTVTENGRTIQREYDVMDRVTRYVDVFTNELRYAYDAVGNLTNLTYPGGNQVSYTYDAANRMASVSDWTGRTTWFAYNTNSLLARITRPNGTKEVRTYDANLRLATLTELNAEDALVSQYTLSYDVAGQLVGEEVTPRPAFVMPDRAQMNFDADDRLVTWNGQAMTSDVDGNATTAPLAGGIGSLVYDARNRLVSTPTQSFEYDAEGLRVVVRELGVTNWYVNNPHAALSQVLMKTSSAGQTNYFIYGAGGLLYALEGTAARYHRFDIRANTVATMDDAGNTTAQYAYSPFGHVQNAAGDTNNAFLFSGRFGVQSDSSGLLYMRARYYSPYSRRFVSQDIIAGSLADGRTLNRFAYANGNPIVFVDPLGLCGEDLRGLKSKADFWNAWLYFATGARGGAEACMNYLTGNIPGAYAAMAKTAADLVTIHDQDTGRHDAEGLKDFAQGLDIVSTALDPKTGVADASALLLDTFARVGEKNNAPEPLTQALQNTATIIRAGVAVHDFGSGSGPITADDVKTIETIMTTPFDLSR